MVAALQNTIGETDQVILGLIRRRRFQCGGSAAARAIGPRLHGIFVDNGLLRKDEYEGVLEAYEVPGPERDAA